MTEKHNLANKMGVKVRVVNVLEAADCLIWKDGEWDVDLEKVKHFIVTGELLKYTHCGNKTIADLAAIVGLKMGVIVKCRRCDGTGILTKRSAYG